MPYRRAFGRSWSIAAACLAVIVLIASFVVWKPWNRTRPVPTVAVTTAVSTAASQGLARDLAVKLGSLQSVQSSAVQMVSEAEARRRRPDLVLEVGPVGDSGSAGANLMMKTAKDGAILWSKDFENPSRNLADLKQQIAFTAARVLGCAAEALDPAQRRLDRETLKLYINSCAQLTELRTTEAEPLVNSLRRVVDKAPRFAGAWKKLLLAESEVVDLARDVGTRNLQAERSLQRDMETARKLDPPMAEAILAQISLAQRKDLATRMALADRAKASDPANSLVLNERARLLLTVGRMREAVDDAKRAVELDPLSPGTRAAYVNALAYSGQTAGARQELQEIQRLWPDSSTTRDLEFRFNVRFGDARAALTEARRQGVRGIVLFLEARLDSSKVGPYVSWLVNRKDINLGRLGVLVQGLGEFRREDELYRVLLSWPNPSDVAEMEDIWFRPALRQFRRDPRFMRVMARTPLLNYWRTSGHWPDFCFDADQPYDCKAEAAKLGR